jgi:hypothetical protein
MRISRRLYSLAQEQNNPALLIGAFRALAVTHYFSAEFECARQYAIRGVATWRSGAVNFSFPVFSTKNEKLIVTFFHCRVGHTSRRIFPVLPFSAAACASLASCNGNF